MIEDVVGGAFKVLARFVGQFFFEIVFELLVKGPGYFIVKQLAKRDPNPDGFAVIITGIAFWAAIGFGAYTIYSNIGGSGNA